MKSLPIDQVTANATLASHLKNSTGAIILRRGAKLSEGMLNRLRRMGVEILDIDSVDSSELLEERKTLLEALEVRFSGTEENPLLQELKRIATGHITL